MAVQIQFRRATGSEWTAANTILAEGEMGINTTTNQFKIGNGSTAWNSLSYAPLSGTMADIDDITNVTITSATSGDLLKWNGTAWVNAAGYALLASPALTGTPSAPTAAALTNTTQVATTAYVDAAVSVGVASVDALDDLSDVTAPTPTSGDLLKWNGTAWVNAAGYALLASPTFTGTVTIPSGASISGFAPLASPALTGTPTAPTAAASTNTTQVATTAFVRSEVAALVGTAGATLDTLGEIATALGNDANLSTTLTTSIGLKAPLASPTFTGTVSGITKTMVGLGSVDNTADTAKPVSTAQQTALDLKANLASPTFTGTVTIPSGASISGFAPLASPTLTGTPLAPTATAGTSTTQIATTAFADPQGDQYVLAGQIF